MTTALQQLTPNITVPDRMITCSNCEHGLINPPPLKRDRPLYQERLAQHIAGHLRTCTCETGRAYAAWLTGVAIKEREHNATLAAQPARAAAARQERIFQNAGIPARYAAYTLAGFEQLAANDPGKRDAIAALRHYAQHGHAQQAGEQRPGLMFWGAPGAGKTGSLSPLFVQLVQGGATGLWLQFNQLMADMKKFEDGQVDARMAACQTVDFLFLDDLGDPAATKTATDYTRDVIFRIIDYRTSRNLPIFVTTNLSPQELADQFHPRIARRLLSACATIHMGGKTLR
jgi:DNA replication protein DnaC